MNISQPPVLFGEEGYWSSVATATVRPCGFSRGSPFGARRIWHQTFPHIKKLRNFGFELVGRKKRNMESANRSRRKPIVGSPNLPITIRSRMQKRTVMQQCWKKVLLLTFSTSKLKMRAFDDQVEECCLAQTCMSVLPHTDDIPLDRIFGAKNQGQQC